MRLPDTYCHAQFRFELRSVRIFAQIVFAQPRGSIANSLTVMAVIQIQEHNKEELESEVGTHRTAIPMVKLSGVRETSWLGGSAFNDVAAKYG